MKKVRICDLEKGDSFMYMGIPCMVTNIKDGRVCYKSHSDNSPSYRHSFGDKCQAKVELIDGDNEKISYTVIRETTYTNIPAYKYEK